MTKEEAKAYCEILDNLKRDLKQIEGEWADKDWNGINVPGYTACTNCNVMIPTDSAKRINLPGMYFCPNCGAKMKGADNE